jgi:hypothetical protein
MTLLNCKVNFASSISVGRYWPVTNIQYPRAMQQQNPTRPTMQPNRPAPQSVVTAPFRHRLHGLAVHTVASRGCSTTCLLGNWSSVSGCTTVIALEASRRWMCRPWLARILDPRVTRRSVVGTACGRVGVYSSSRLR